MSMDFNVYVGAFIELPEDFDWLDFSMAHEIDENKFTVISSDEDVYYLIPNQDMTSCESYSDTSSNQVMILEASAIKQAIKEFKVETKTVIKKIKEHYDETLEVSYGAIPYYS